MFPQYVVAVEGKDCVEGEDCHRAHLASAGKRKNSNNLLFISIIVVAVGSRKSDWLIAGQGARRASSILASEQLVHACARYIHWPKGCWPQAFACNAVLAAMSRLVSGAGVIEAWAAGSSWSDSMKGSLLDDGDIAHLLSRTVDLLRHAPSVMACWSTPRLLPEKL